MNIAMLSYHTSPLAALGGKYSGGMNVYVRELSAHLEELGHRIDIFTRGTEPSIQQLTPQVRVIDLPAGPRAEIPKNQLSAFVPNFAQAVLDFRKGESTSYDLIHAHYWMSGLVGEALKARWNTPLVLMFHTLGLVKNRITAIGERESDERILGERRALAAADMVVAATPAEQADLQWLYEVPTSKICVIPPGVDLAQFSPRLKDEARAELGISQEDSLLLFVGRIEALKGVDTLIRAVSLLASGHEKKLKVLIVGGDVEEDLNLLGTEMNRLRSLARELGVQDQIEFIGSRRQRELPTYYAAADVVAMPSYSESFGMVALEAMACARPVVASRVGGLAYLVQDGVTGFHVQEGNAGELAARLVHLMGNDALLQQMGVAGRKVAEGYSWDQAAIAIDSLYRKLVTKKQ